MKFSELAGYIEKIENTSSRLEITELLANLYKKLSEEEIDKTTYLLQGRAAPMYEKTEFSMAEKMVVRAIVLALNLDKKLFDSHYEKIGDLGKTVEFFKKQISLFDEKDLAVTEVFAELYRMAIVSGKGSQEIKVNILSNLIRQLDSISCRYLVRIPTGVMRLGFSDMTVLDSLSWMIGGDKSYRSVIEHAYHVRPDLGFIGRTIKKKGIEELKYIKPSIFTPILMMRAERLSSGKEIIGKIGECAIEDKYDGLRLQAHFSKSKGVKLYSRNLEEVTSMYPDIVEGIKKEIHANEVIFEGEAIGFDPHSGTFLPFQETVQRKRKYDIEKMARQIPLKLFVFELLNLEGTTYLNVPYIERRRKLEKIIRVTGDIFKDTIIVAPEFIAKDEKEIELEFDDAISKGLEGIIAKKLSGIYQAGARGWNWIKFKRSYSAKIEDTIDCLIMGFDYGKGKRTDFGIGAFLVGVYNEDQDKFVTVAKIGTGLSDIEWKELKKRCDKYTTVNKPVLYDVDKAMSVDIWVKPVLVAEIRADEISRSPVHTAGRKMKPTKTRNAVEIDIPGFALRFPRLERFRDDKRPEDVTTLKELDKMFHSQKK
ncbi:MAG: putative DNA ligase [Candidatus Roizmanbacteria bacterium GW2011_GWA2_36_23]|uniref:Probable DNA ligase n=1 Tax=Candidatus Roizmanbacteria bacterium GW2011_GWA2_36_23 TaxID=1618480 RepID=A0A0G0GP23_9BACT|nr:MAG: putative DNA ligase [Candidatus Roizmanbacteria bacterium GW2011_GWA2_36_23]